MPIAGSSWVSPAMQYVALQIVPNAAGKCEPVHTIAIPAGNSHESDGGGGPVEFCRYWTTACRRRRGSQLRLELGTNVPLGALPIRATSPIAAIANQTVSQKPSM